MHRFVGYCSVLNHDNSQQMVTGEYREVNLESINGVIYQKSIELAKLITGPPEAICGWSGPA